MNNEMDNLIMDEQLEDVNGGMLGKVIAAVTEGPIVDYTIKPGDTLSAIALGYNTTVRRIVELNNIANPNVIKAYDVIKVPNNKVV